jgi:endonuclease/exonuclease/phosphatase family metal-dependent hydrolase
LCNTDVYKTQYYQKISRSHQIWWLRFKSFCLLFSVAWAFYAPSLYGTSDTYTTPPSRDQISFLGPDGQIRPPEEVKNHMITFNEATRELYEGLGEPEQAQKLKLITFNAGLFDSGTPIRVQKYKERAPYIIPALQKADFDVLCLQEVFYFQDLKRLQKFADENGYYFYRGRSGRIRNRHGLVMLVKKSLTPHAPQFQEHRFRMTAWYERLFGYKKSMISATLKLANGRTASFTNTHVTAFRMQETLRAQQIYDMMKAVVGLAKADYLFVSGDLNEVLEEAPRYSDLYRMNAVQRLISRFKLVGGYVVANPDKNEPTLSRTENPTAAFSFTSAFGKGDNGRIDYNLSTSQPDRHILVDKTDRIFTEDIPVTITPPWYVRWGSKKLHRGTRKNCKLSDHFGLLTHLTLF